MKHVELARKTKSSSHWTRLAAASLLAVAALAGCGGGSDGAAGAPGVAGKDVDPAVLNDLTAKITALTQAANPETCVTCHTGSAPVAASGAMHQAKYDVLYQEGVIKITNMNFSASGTTSTLTFNMTKNGSPFNCATTATNFQIGSSWATYDSANGEFTTPPGSTFTFSLITNKSWTEATNLCTFTRTGLTADQVTKMAGNGEVVVYGVDEIQSKGPAALYVKGKYPFAGILKIGTVGYSSAANVAGCEGCHTTPYLKHGYISGTVDKDPTSQFLVCKACHTDDGNGSHWDWQIEKDDPARAAAIAGGSPFTDAEKTKYAYKKKLMNDVHMSHAMEFPYPQSMKNCQTCHAGKLDTVLADTQFTAETCISCHSVDGLKAKLTAAKYQHDAFVVDDPTLRAAPCALCHKAGGVAPTFKTIHKGGFDPKIYTASGTRYSNAIKVTLDSTTVANNKLTIKFSAADTGATGFDMAKIKPTILVGLYGYNSKDFIIAAHGTAADKARNLEYVVGTTHPRFTTVSAAGGKWEVTADLSLWADKIAAGTIKRAEIGVMPYLDHPTLKTTTRDGKVVPDAIGLDAPSVTFNLNTNKVELAFGEIVDVAKGCNSCHDQLATTFHTADRGGNIKVCRICHEVSSPGGHLEMQSRSIDSYVHAIHSFQAFDTNNINFKDPAAAHEYKLHIGTDYPKFGISNCESCHKPGTYDVPDQGKSMPGVLSASYTNATWLRDIGGVPQYVTGPAVRACGSCHRSQMINKDDAAGLAILNSHFKQNGYMVENETGLWDAIVTKIMTVFK